MNMKQSIDWNQAYLRGKDYAALPTRRLTELINLLPKNIGKKHLDIGCGTGQLNRDMFHRGFLTTGIDVSDVAISAAKESVDTSNDSISFEVGDVSVVDGKKFDLITCKYVYTFVNDKDEFMKKVAMLMNINSIFVIISPNIALLDEGKKSIALSKEEIESKLSQYFNVEILTKDRDIYFICTTL